MINTNVSQEDFSALLEESLSAVAPQEGSVVKGMVISIEKDIAVIDVGLKVEGRVPLQEFSGGDDTGDISVGDTVEVYLERIENALGEAVLSRDKARREESWIRLDAAFGRNEHVTGQIYNTVKGGYTVDLGGAIAFLPRSQVDIRPIRDIAPLMRTPQPFQILKMDRRRGNIVVSRRVVLEETRAEQRSELVQNLAEGQVLEGVVKNITDYGAFVDLGGIDGLLHVTDIAWRRINNPREVFSVGDTLKVKVIRVNQETQRVSLGMKQLEPDPWNDIAAKFPVGQKFSGRVTNITEYGAFVELMPGIEGLIHVSEMSWTKKNVHPGKIVATSQEVDVMILEVDPVKRRVSLGLKQALQNPWKSFAEQHPVGSVVEGEVKNKTEFGLFIGLDGYVDGMVHLSDLDWTRQGEDVIDSFPKGSMVKAVVLDVDLEKERVSLGIKQLTEDPLAATGSVNVRKGAVLTCEVLEVRDGGINARIDGTEITTFLRRSDLSRDRAEQRPERFAVGDRFDARVTQIDKRSRRVSVSIKELEIADEKEAVAQYGSSDSGASLGDILSAALMARDDENGAKDVSDRPSGKSAKSGDARAPATPAASKSAAPAQKIAEKTGPKPDDDDEASAGSGAATEGKGKSASGSKSAKADASKADADKAKAEKSDGDLADEAKTGTAKAGAGASKPGKAAADAKADAAKPDAGQTDGAAQL